MAPVKYYIFFPFVLCLLLSLAAIAEEAPSIAIRNVTVIDVIDGTLVRNQTVLIEGSRIRSIGPTDKAALPSYASVVVEGSGKYLIPGLMDMHVHIFNNVSRRPPNRWAFPLFVANGVTGVREMWTEFAQMPTVEQWRRSVSDGELLAPRILAAGALIDGPPVSYPNMPEATVPADGRRFVREAVQAGSDFIKVYSLLTPAVYQAIANEARKAGIPVVGHIPLQTPVSESVRAGQVTNEHLYQVREACTNIEDQLVKERLQFYARSHNQDEEFSFLDEQVRRTAEAYDERTCLAVAQTLMEIEQWQVPTLWNEKKYFVGISPERVSDARLAFLPPDERAVWIRDYEDNNFMYEGDLRSLRRGWERTLHVVEALNRAGVGILVGTDFGNSFVFPGMSVHAEMATLVEAGLTKLEALQAATINPALYLGATDSLGTVAEGKIADLVLLDANPLESISNIGRIHAVILNGQLLRRSDLDALIGHVLSTYESEE